MLLKLLGTGEGFTNQATHCVETLNITVFAHSFMAFIRQDDRVSIPASKIQDRNNLTILTGWPRWINPTALNYR